MLNIFKYKEIINNIYKENELLKKDLDKKNDEIEKLNLNIIDKDEKYYLKQNKILNNNNLKLLLFYFNSLESKYKKDYFTNDKYNKCIKVFFDLKYKKKKQNNIYQQLFDNNINDYLDDNEKYFIFKIIYDNENKIDNKNNIINNNLDRLKYKCEICFKSFYNGRNDIIEHYKINHHDKIIEEYNRTFELYSNSEYYIYFNNRYNIYNNMNKCDKQEKHLFETLSNKLVFNNYPYSLLTNKKILNYYPDIFINTNNFILIIEIDENQHKSYNKENESNRMSDIINYNKQNTLLNKSTYFIKFNPNEYKNNINSLSMYEKSSKDNYFINFDEFQKRTNILLDLIISLNNYIFESNEFFKITYLFYDDENKLDEKLIIENIKYDYCNTYIESEDFICIDCNKSYTNQISLNNHLLKHSIKL